jgi:hypothetical protein
MNGLLDEWLKNCGVSSWWKNLLGIARFCGIALPRRGAAKFCPESRTSCPRSYCLTWALCELLMVRTSGGSN